LVKVQREHYHAQRRSVAREFVLPTKSSALLARQLLASGTSPSDALLQKELRQRLQQALGRLKTEDREVILMRHFEGLSNTEVAQVLGVSASGATMRYGRALMRLKDVLTRELPEEASEP
jgi:RNA polymerase sigma-70 factor (ECF subfamily)